MDKENIRDIWEAAAPGWAKWESKFSKGIEGATLGLLDAAAVGEGSRVLDIASGAGAQTLLAASRVGPDGMVVASDISSTMLDHLRNNAKSSAISNIETVTGTAEEVAVANGPFDAAICRLGLMLFPAPVSAVAAVREGLRPGGRFAAMVIASPADNPFFSKSMGMYLPMRASSHLHPDSPGCSPFPGQMSWRGFWLMPAWKM